MAAYNTYFDNFFATLPISRVNFKGLAQTALTRGREAGLGPEFAARFTELETAIGGFDDNLTDASTATQGDTEAYRTARTAWLAFVDDTMKDHVTPKLRKLPVYAAFKQYSKSKLAALPQPELLQESKNLLKLYQEHAAALGQPTLPAQAQALYDALAATDEARDATEATIGSARVALSADWLAVARALRRFKAQLELTFDEPEQVYRFFDFSKVNKNGRALKKGPAAPTA